MSIQELFKPKTDNELKRDSYLFLKKQTLDKTFYLTRKTINQEPVFIVGKVLTNADVCNKLKPICHIGLNEVRLIGYVFVNRKWRESYWKKDGTFICATGEDNLMNTEINHEKDFKLNITEISIKELKLLKFKRDKFAWWI